MLKNGQVMQCCLCFVYEALSLSVFVLCCGSECLLVVRMILGFVMYVW